MMKSPSSNRKVSPYNKTIRSNLDDLSALKCSLNQISTSNNSLLHSCPTSLSSIDENSISMVPSELLSSKKRKLKGWGSYESRKSYGCLSSLDRKRNSEQKVSDQSVSDDSISQTSEDDSWGFFIDD